MLVLVSLRRNDDGRPNEPEPLRRLALEGRARATGRTHQLARAQPWATSPLAKFEKRSAHQSLRGLETLLLLSAPLEEIVALPAGTPARADRADGGDPKQFIRFKPLKHPKTRSAMKKEGLPRGTRRSCTAP